MNDDIVTCPQETLCTFHFYRNDEFLQEIQQTKTNKLATFCLGFFQL